MCAERRSLRKLLRCKRGAAAIEFAIVAPVFVMMLVGIASFGWGMHCISSLRLALEESARTLYLHPTWDEDHIRWLVRHELQKLGDPNVSVATVETTPIGGVNMAKITGTYSFHIDVPFLSSYHVDYQTSVVVPLSS